MTAALQHRHLCRREHPRGALTLRRSGDAPLEVMHGARAKADQPSDLASATDLPLPPSTNRLWRAHRGRVHRSATYVSWLKEAGRSLL